MTQNNYSRETDQFILKPNNQPRQMGQLKIKRNKRFPDQTIDFEINLSGNKKVQIMVNQNTEKSNINKMDLSQFGPKRLTWKEPKPNL